MLTRRRFLQSSAMLAALNLAPRPTAALLADDPIRKVEPFGDAIAFSGSARDRGRAYGKHFASAIHAFFEREILAAFVGKPSLKDDLLRYAGACAKVIREECPFIAEELEGMAEGSGLRLEEHVLLTLHEELYHRGVLPPVPHCTAVAVGNPETRDDLAFVGQTWDWMQSVAGMATMVEWRREDGPSLLAYGFPGLWVGAGMNANGLALCWTSADLGRPGQTPRVGLPSYVILAHLLYQENLDAVREAAKRDRHAGWFTFVMADGGGRLMSIEGSPDSIEVDDVKGRLIRVGFGTRRMSKTPAGKPVVQHARCATMNGLLDKAAGQIDLRTMQQSFGDPSRGICVGKSTIDMMVYDTSRRVAHLSRGPEYGVSWKAYRLT